MSVFRCETRARFSDVYETIADHVITHGYAVIEAWDAEPATLLDISEHFGRIQSHVRADASGIVGISADAAQNREWQDFRSEYIGTSSEEFLPHTDGSYLHGLVRDAGTYVELFPPKMLVLQCTQNASVGGGSVLIDGQQVYRDMALAHPGHLEALSRKGCVTYCRDDQIALNCAVFETLDDATVMLRFRYDSAAYVADWALDAFHTLQADYFANPRYQSHLKLAKGQILLIDNYRMLHGRDAFSTGPTEQKRSLHRIWLARDNLPILSNAANEHRERRALGRFRAYGVLPGSGARAASGRLPTGIRNVNAFARVAPQRQLHRMARVAA
jgi:alpha-ketoglutarate-dependent taurine dioxygenase